MGSRGGRCDCHPVLADSGRDYRSNAPVTAQKPPSIVCSANVRDARVVHLEVVFPLMHRQTARYRQHATLLGAEVRLRRDSGLRVGGDVLEFRCGELTRHITTGQRAPPIRRLTTKAEAGGAAPPSRMTLTVRVTVKRSHRLAAQHLDGSRARKALMRVIARRLMVMLLEHHHLGSQHSCLSLAGKLFSMRAVLHLAERSVERELIVCEDFENTKGVLDINKLEHTIEESLVST